jgi:hypothetical protein
MKDLKLKMRNLHASQTLGWSWNWNTKDKDEVKRREVCECEGWTWGLDTIGDPSMLRLVRKAAPLARIFPTLDLSIEEKVVWR